MKGRRTRLLLLLLAAVAALALRQFGPEPVAPLPAPAVLVPAPAAAPAIAEPAPAPSAPRQTVEQKIVESGIAVHIVRRARIDPPTGSLAAQYAKLAPEAASGNAVSQYRLGLLLYECHDVPAEHAALEREIETLHQTRRRGAWEVGTPADEERTLRRRYDDCTGVPAAERSGFREHLKAAADAGVLEAELNLPLKLPEAEYCQFLSECPPEQRAKQEALQKEAIDYLSRARDAGSVSALWTFGAWYAEGEVLPKDEVEAYAHFRALDQINAATNQPRRFERMLADMKRRLRPVDLDQAEARSKALLSNPNCCVITP